MWQARALLVGGLLVASGASSGEPILFREVAAERGLSFVHRHGGSGERYMVETMVGGVVVFDYDLDGDPDLFLVDGGALPGYDGPAPRSRLYRNDGGRFLDVSDRALPADLPYGSGAVAGDVDGDGAPDLYLTAFGQNRLLRNRGDGTFEDATEKAGVGDRLWSMSASLFDSDRDGDLDLYVTNYVNFSLDNHRFCGDRERGIQGYCHPDSYRPQPDRFYRNRGDGTFEEATAAVGLAAAPGAGLGVVAGDVDGDGWSDLYVANDLSPNLLFRNRGDGTFEDESLLSGTGYSDRGLPEAGMGVELADLDEDGLPDLFVTNFELETNAYYKNLGDGLFLDSRFPAGLGEPSLRSLAFGVVAADFDHDGDLDLAIGNGHVSDTAAELMEGSRYAQPNQLFENLGRGAFREVKSSGFEQPARVSRGVAAGDLDLDGDLDLVVVNSNERAELYENRTEVAADSWLLLSLSDAGRPAIGARVTLAGAESVSLRELRTASSYLSQNEMRLHFGLAGSAKPPALHVAWPSGDRLRLEGAAAGRRIHLAR